MRLTRRQLLRSGGLMAVAGTAGVAGPTTSSAAAAPPTPAGNGPAAARPLAARGSIESSSPLLAVQHDAATQWAGLTGLTLADPDSQPQSLAFDSVHDVIYALQVAQPGALTYTRSDGERVASRAAYARDQHGISGDLCLTRMDLGGRITGVMYLLGFGHGVSLGVEPDPRSSTVHIWTECQAQTDGVAGARGNMICRFPFQDEGLVTTTDIGVTRYAPVPGATNLTPSVDVNGENRLVTVRYRVDGAFHYSTWDLDLALSSGFRAAPLATRPEPAGVAGGRFTFQGWTTYGRHLYTLDGDPHGTGPKAWSIRLTSCDLNDPSPGGSVIAQSTSTVFRTAVSREPEGLAVYTGTSPARLAFMVTTSPTPPMTFDIAAMTAPDPSSGDGVPRATRPPA